MVGMVWENKHENNSTVQKVIDIIRGEIDLTELFDNTVEEKKLQLAGIMAYYGKHYVSFTSNPQENVWYYCDDENITMMDTNLEQVKTKMARNKLQPVMLMYTVSGGEQRRIGRTRNKWGKAKQREEQKEKKRRRRSKRKKLKKEN